MSVSTDLLPNAPLNALDPPLPTSSAHFPAPSSSSTRHYFKPWFVYFRKFWYYVFELDRLAFTWATLTSLSVYKHASEFIWRRLGTRHQFVSETEMHTRIQVLVNKRRIFLTKVKKVPIPSANVYPSFSYQVACDARLRCWIENDTIGLSIVTEQIMSTNPTLEPKQPTSDDVDLTHLSENQRKSAKSASGKLSSVTTIAESVPDFHFSNSHFPQLQHVQSALEDTTRRIDEQRIYLQSLCGGPFNMSSDLEKWLSPKEQARIQCAKVDLEELCIRKTELALDLEEAELEIKQIQMQSEMDTVSRHLSQQYSASLALCRNPTERNKQIEQIEASKKPKWYTNFGKVQTCWAKRYYTYTKRVPKNKPPEVQDDEIEENK